MQDKIVFDVDDILWALNEKMAKLAEVDYNKCVVFSVNENEFFSKKEKEKIIKIYGSCELFENIKWFDGIERIDELNNIADVRINSNASNTTVAEIKRKQLKTVVHIPDEHMKINVVDISTGGEKKKTIDADTYILIDDSPHNVALSPAKFNIMRRTPWNQSEHGLNQIKGKNVIFCDTLNEIIDKVYELLLR